MWTMKIKTEDNYKRYPAKVKIPIRFAGTIVNNWMENFKLSHNSENDNAVQHDMLDSKIEMTLYIFVWLNIRICFTNIFVLNKSEIVIFASHSSINNLSIILLYYFLYLRL